MDFMIEADGITLEVHTGDLNTMITIHNNSSTRTAMDYEQLDVVLSEEQLTELTKFLIVWANRKGTDK